MRRLYFTPPKRCHSANIKTLLSVCGRIMRWGRDRFLIDGTTELVTCANCRKKLGLPVKTWHEGKWHDGMVKCQKCKGLGYVRLPGSRNTCRKCKGTGLQEAL
jgi:hypothetical protein